MRSGGGWSGRDDGWDQGKSPSIMPEEKSLYTFAKEELSRITPPAETGAEPEAGAQGDDPDHPGFTSAQVEGWKRDLAAGKVTLEELGRLYSLGEDELAALQTKAKKAAPPKVNIAARVKELGTLKRSDPKAYYSDATQKEEIALIEAQLAGAESETDAAAEDDADGEQQTEAKAAAAEAKAELQGDRARAGRHRQGQARRRKGLRRRNAGTRGRAFGPAGAPPGQRAGPRRVAHSPMEGRRR